MKKIIQGVFIVTLVLMSQIILVTEVNAENWSNFTSPSETPPFTIGIDDGIDFNPDAMNFKLLGGDNKAILYKSDGHTVDKIVPLFTTSFNNIFETGQSVRITKVGVRNGKYLDLLIKNIGLVRGGYFNTLPNGTVTFYRSNRNASDLYSSYLNMEVFYNDDTITLKNQSFYLPTRITSIDYYLGQFVKGYPTANTKAFYYSNSDNFIKTNVKLDRSFSSLFTYMSAMGRSSSNEGNFTVYGDTGENGYKLGSYNGSDAASAIHFFQPGQKSLLPVNYDPLQIPKEATSINNGEKMSIEMKQTLNTQSSSNYIPTQDSFELVITEKNSGFLNIDDNDFILSIDGNEISNDGSSYTLEIDRQDTQHEIKIILKSEFLNHWNQISSSNGVEKVLSIKQTSNINQNETSIKEAINEGQFIMPFSSKLTYNIAPDSETNPLEVTVDTPIQDVLLNVEPELTADIETKKTVRKGTILNDIPINQLIQNERNINFPWDRVTAIYKEPDTVFNEIGTHEIVLNLISETFSTIVPMEVSINVVENFEYEIIATEQNAWTTDEQLVANNNWISGVVFDPSNPEIEHDIAVDSITITAKKNKDDTNFVPIDIIDMLSQGKTIYRATVVGHVELDGEIISFTDENIEIPVNIKKLDLIGEGSENIQIGRLTKFEDIDFKTWVTNVQLEGQLTESSPKLEIPLNNNSDFDYTVEPKSGQSFNTDTIGYQNYTLIITATTQINGEQTFNPVEVEVRFLVIGLGLHHPDEIVFEPGVSEVYKKQILKRQNKEWAIDIQDTRINPVDDWQVYVKLEQEFQTELSNGITQKISDLLVFRGQDSGQPHYNEYKYVDKENLAILHGKGNLNKLWDEDYGLLLISDPKSSMSIKAGDYTALIQFTLADVPMEGDKTNEQ
ncbi:hypothetical protein [Vagococcus fluvialis]|uniref:Uncharacterized protein n=1 Tax=Vagococcus fluvialis TaxID=2738 RepID=A0A7X6D9Z6_9ENTE|nr:hypothetical protein [Vagococcus fluvialis]NKC68534.1 hypothetical protein [Vagococcus fluvialis]